MRFFGHILVPLDGSRLAESAVAHAEKPAKGCGTENMTLIRVLERTKRYGKVIDTSKQPEEKGVSEAASRMEGDARSYIVKMAKKLSERGLVV